jgi:opacity protein-like surface antigen
MMHRLVAATALAVFASPGMAQDGGAYVGVEGGLLFPRDLKHEVNSTRVQTVPTGQGLLGQTVTTTTATFGSGFVADYKRGSDLDVIAGYDFGLFRLEGELGYKRARLNELTASETLLAGINTAPIGGVTSENFAFGDRTTIRSGMINGLVDLGMGSGIKIYGGGGFGRARVEAFSDRDKSHAWQIIGGVATALSPNIDLGLKYRYFQTGSLRFDTAASFTGPGGATSESTFSNRAKFRSHSLLASLMYNFRSFDAPPPAPPVAAVPASPPSTQTCPDGLVINATGDCPVPPPPPSAPAAQGERG